MSRMRNVLEYLEQSAERFPEKSAVTDGICTYTYKELLAYSRKIGSGDCGILQIGNSQSLFLQKRGPIHWLLFWGLFKPAAFMC